MTERITSRVFTAISRTGGGYPLRNVSTAGSPVFVFAIGRAGGLAHPAGSNGVDRHAWPHRRREIDRAQVLALRRARLGANHGIHQSGEVVAQLGFAVGGLADVGMDDAGFVDPILDPATLDILDGAANIEGDRAGTRVRHQPTRA